MITTTKTTTPVGPALKSVTCFVFCTLFLWESTTAQLTATEMVKEAKQKIENLTIQQAKVEIVNGNIVLIDIREAEELTKGKIPGATHAPRGMLEFYADSTLPYYKPVFKKESRIIIYCASSGRSALAVQTLKSMGYKNVTHINGGFNAWKEAGLPVEQ
jgi:rhodanese-related sulfurtransferase